MPTEGGVSKRKGWDPGPAPGTAGHAGGALTLSMKEANLLFRVLICSFSWVRTAWMSGSTSSLRGLSRLWFTVTGVMPPRPGAPL